MSSLLEKLEQKACTIHYATGRQTVTKEYVTIEQKKPELKPIHVISLKNVEALVTEAIDGIRERFINAHVAPFGWLKNLENLEKEVLHVLEGERKP